MPPLQVPWPFVQGVRGNICLLSNAVAEQAFTRFVTIACSSSSMAEVVVWVWSSHDIRILTIFRVGHAVGSYHPVSRSFATTHSAYTPCTPGPTLPFPGRGEGHHLPAAAADAAGLPPPLRRTPPFGGRRPWAAPPFAGGARAHVGTQASRPNIWVWQWSSPCSGRCTAGRRVAQCTVAILPFWGVFSFPCVELMFATDFLISDCFLSPAG